MHLFKHAVESGDEVLVVANYSITGKGYRNKVRKGKIAKALLSKEKKATLNRQDQSINCGFYICFTDLEHVNTKAIFESYVFT